MAGLVLERSLVLFNPHGRFDGTAFGLPLCAGASYKKLCAGGVWSISALHVGPDQPDLRRNPNPNPNFDPLGGSRSTGAVTRLHRVFWWRFSKKKRAAQKASLDQQNQHPAQRFLQDVPVHRASPASGGFEKSNSVQHGSSLKACFIATTAWLRSILVVRSDIALLEACGSCRQVRCRYRILDMKMVRHCLRSIARSLAFWRLPMR